MNDRQIILDQPNSPQCPLCSYKLYISKLTELPDLFQQPNPTYKRPGDIQYKKSPVGINTIGNFLASISQASGLSCKYTNHCIRGTTATCMKRAGYSLTEVSSVIKHKNLVSEYLPNI